MQKVSADAGTLGVLGFSYLEANADKVQAVSLAGIAPTEATIADLTYPGSRRLYIYLKGEHFVAKPKMKEFVAAYAKAWGKGVALEKRGLVPRSAAGAQGATAQSPAPQPHDPAGVT